MKYKVKDTPILKNKTIYGVGEIFPYTEDDKKLLWNLIDLPDNSSEAGVKDESKKTDSKKPAPKKKVAAKKTTKKKVVAKK